MVIRSEIPGTCSTYLIINDRGLLSFLAYSTQILIYLIPFHILQRLCYYSSCFRSLFCQLVCYFVAVHSGDYIIVTELCLLSSFRFSKHYQTILELIIYKLIALISAFLSNIMTISYPFLGFKKCSFCRIGSRFIHFYLVHFYILEPSVYHVMSFLLNLEIVFCSHYSLWLSFLLNYFIQLYFFGMSSWGMS